MAKRADTGNSLTANSQGYDSAQREGYETETHAPEARSTTNSIHARANSVHDERTENERAAKGEPPPVQEASVEKKGGKKRGA